MTPDRLRTTLLGVACGDALGRPVEGLSSAEIARSYGRVTNTYADGVHGAATGTVTACTRDALVVARELYTDTTEGDVTESERSDRTDDVSDASDDTSAGVEPELPTTDEILPRVVPCAGTDRADAIEIAIGERSAAARGAAVALVDLLRHAPGTGSSHDAGSAAVDAALGRASDRNAPCGRHWPSRSIPWIVSTAIR